MTKQYKVHIPSASDHVRTILDSLVIAIDQLEDVMENFDAILNSAQKIENDICRRVVSDAYKNLLKNYAFKSSPFDGLAFNIQTQEPVDIYNLYRLILIKIITNGEKSVGLEIISQLKSADNNDSINFNWFKYKNNIIKLTCIHCAYADLYRGMGETGKEVEHLLEASSLKGMAMRLASEVKISLLESYYLSLEIADRTFKLMTKEIVRKRSASRQKNMQIRIEFAKTEWLKMQKLKNRENTLGADVLIAKFGKKVPAFNTLRRLISQWKEG